jgi:hypothetical protein
VQLLDQDVVELAAGIMGRYLGSDEGAAYVKGYPGTHLIARLEPGDLRAWDFTDE